MLFMTYVVFVFLRMIWHILLIKYIYNIFLGYANECFRALVNNQFKESFDIIFMGNEKKLLKY